MSSESLEDDPRNVPSNSHSDDYPMALENHPNQLSTTEHNTENVQGSETDKKTISTQENENSNSSTDTSRSPSRKRPLDESMDDEGMTCSICLDNWTNSGEHRICSLKCGHLFGYKCITRWLDSEVKKLCPTCKKKVHPYDIRYIYAKKVIAMDTTELTAMKIQLQEAHEEKNRIQMELAKNMCKEHSLLKTIQELKKTIADLQSRVMSQQQFGNKYIQSCNISLQNQIKLYRDKSIDLGKNSGCRVINANISLDLVTVSIKSPTNFYTGYGIRKFNISTYKPIAFIGLHSAPIRDIKFHKENPWLLTASMDKKSSIVDLNCNEKVMSATCDSPIWSCCWDTDISPIFYLGTNKGSIVKHDMRNISQQLDTLEVTGDMSPVVSVQAVKRSTNSCNTVGILSCKLQSLWFFEYTNPTYITYPLPIEGPFSSMTYCNSTGHMLVSARPSEKYKQSRHILGTLSKIEESMGCDVLHTLHGGYKQKMLSRSHLFSNGSDFATAYVEDTRTVDVWNVNTGKRVGGTHVSDYVLDLTSDQSEKSAALLALTESKIEFFKFTS